MELKQISFIGAGNMAHAIVTGLLKANWSPTQISVSGRNWDHLNTFEKLGVHVFDNNQLAVEKADIVVLAVKPYQALEALASIRGTLSPKTLVISVMAGVSLSTLKKSLGDHDIIIRAMPNTPVLVQAGVTGLYAADPQNLTFANSILSTVGQTIILDKEPDIDRVIGVSGSGPAYLMWILEQWLLSNDDTILSQWEQIAKKIQTQQDFVSALKQKHSVEQALYLLCLQGLIAGGLQLAFDQEQAFHLATVTANGTIELIQQSQKSIEELRQNITSKGGTTEAALKVLAQFEWIPLFNFLKSHSQELKLEAPEIGSFIRVMQETVYAAFQRANELNF